MIHVRVTESDRRREHIRQRNYMYAPVSSGVNVLRSMCRASLVTGYATIARCVAVSAGTRDVVDIFRHADLSTASTVIPYWNTAKLN